MVSSDLILGDLSKLYQTVRAPTPTLAVSTKILFSLQMAFHIPHYLDVPSSLKLRNVYSLC